MNKPAQTLLEAIRIRDAKTETVEHSWPCADRRALLKMLDEERMQYISLVGQMQEAGEKHDALGDTAIKLAGAREDPMGRA
jgi:hypothetical protein